MKGRFVTTWHDETHRVPNPTKTRRHERRRVAAIARKDAFAAAEAYECADCGHHGFSGWNCQRCGEHNLIRRY